MKFCGNGEKVEEEDDRFFNQAFPAKRLFQRNRARESFSKLDETQLLQSVGSPKVHAENGFDTALVLLPLWNDSVSQRNIITIIPESPQPMRRRQGSFGDRNRLKSPEDELEIFSRSIIPQNRREAQPNGNDLVIPESPLNTPHKRRRVIDRDLSDETRAASTFPVPSMPHSETLQETQYEDRPNKLWGSLPTLVADRHLIAGAAVGKRHIGASGNRQQSYSDGKASGSGDLLTVSQLLPQSLMESLPIPPPLTQWSIPTPGDVDCDEL